MKKAKYQVKNEKGKALATGIKTLADAETEANVWYDYYEHAERHNWVDVYGNKIAPTFCEDIYISLEENGQESRWHRNQETRRWEQDSNEEENEEEAETTNRFEFYNERTGEIADSPEELTTEEGDEISTLKNGERTGESFIAEQQPPERKWYQVKDNNGESYSLPTESLEEAIEHANFWYDYWFDWAQEHGWEDRWDATPDQAYYKDIHIEQIDKEGIRYKHWFRNPKTLLWES